MFRNRLDGYFAPSPADRILASAWGCKIELLRFDDDDGPECSCQIEIKSEIQGDPTELLSALLAHFRTPRATGGAA